MAVSELLGQSRVHGGDRFTQPEGFAGEVAADLVGIQVTFGEQVTGAGQRHVPTLGGIGRKCGHHAERAWLAVPGRLEGSQQPCHVRVACPRQHPVEFDVGIGACGDAAEDLEDGFLLEHHAGVALLGAHQPRRHVERQCGVGLLDEAHSRIGRADRGRRVDQRQQILPGCGVIESVVRGAVASRIRRAPDDRHFGVLLDGTGVIPLHDDLIALGCAVGVRHVEQHEVEVVAQRNADRRLG